MRRWVVVIGVLLALGMAAMFVRHQQKQENAELTRIYAENSHIAFEAEVAQRTAGDDWKVEKVVPLRNGGYHVELDARWTGKRQNDYLGSERDLLETYEERRPRHRQGAGLADGFAG